MQETRTAEQDVPCGQISCIFPTQIKPSPNKKNKISNADFQRS